MRRHLRVARALATDPSIPRWLRVLLIFGALPIPGPVDNVALIVAMVILFTCYRDRIGHHYAIEATEPLAALDTWGAWA